VTIHTKAMAATRTTASCSIADPHREVSIGKLKLTRPTLSSTEPKMKVKVELSLCSPQLSTTS
jgi:hypothetical protein